MSYFFKKYRNFFRYLFLFIFIFCVSFFVTYVCMPVNCDEIWSYGFSYNISHGMVIYRDFNTLQTPLYFMIVSLFIRIFGSYLLSMHIFDSILVAFIGIMLFRIVRYKVVMILPFIMIFFPSGYNLFCLFWLILIIYLINVKKDNDLLIAFIIGLVFITKQNIGVVLFIPCFFYSKHKFRNIIAFLIPFFVLSIYLLFNGAFYQFIDYSFLGMLEFNEKNKCIDSFILFLEILSLLYLTYCFIKSGGKNKEIFYILVFQFMLYPLVDFYHFFVSFLPVMYLIVKSIHEIHVLIIVCFAVLLFHFFAFFMVDKDIHMNNDMLFSRNAGDLAELAVTMYDYLDGNLSYLFATEYFSYFIKLYYDIPISQYDFLISGNMGYHGGEKKMKKLFNICKENHCVFMADSVEYFQFYPFYQYIIQNYKKVDRIYDFDIYSS